MIVADTSAVVALIDADDRHHGAVREIFEADPGGWVLPWAVLPEVDDLVLNQVSADAEHAFLLDLAEGNFRVERGQDADLGRAASLSRRYRSLGLGLVDAVVMTVSERLGAAAIATLDRRHFDAVAIRGRPELLPRGPPLGARAIRQPPLRASGRARRSRPCGGSRRPALE